MHKKIDIFFLIFFSCLLVGCTAYIDARREAGVIQFVGQSKGSNIAICYNPIFNDVGQLDELAQNNCAPQKAIYQDVKYFNCTFFYPNTAFYTCE